jgi:hypothetical protein
MAVRAEKSNDRSNRIVKQLEAMKKNWTVRLEKLSADQKKDDLLSWEQLGIDALFVDEAHLHKNLYRFTKMTRVAGLPLTSSERAFDLFLKTRYTMQLHGHAQRGVVFATATPVANTMAEIHTMMRYLQPNRLEELGLQQFDAWAATFGESVTALEIAPDGSGYRMHTRFARFINVPELMAVFGEVADIRTAEMLDLPVPKLRGGKPRIVPARPSPSLKAFVQTLVRGRSHPQRRRQAERRQHAGDHHRRPQGRAGFPAGGAALARFDENGKVAACVREVHAIWQRTTEFRGAQLVFCDLSSPKGGKSFSVYDDLRDRLIGAGIPEKEIAFIHDAETDAQKARCSRRCAKAGCGCCWGPPPRWAWAPTCRRASRPCITSMPLASLRRRAARGAHPAPGQRVRGSGDLPLRHGRQLRRLHVADAGDQGAFIAQVMSGDKGIRSLEDVELAALSYAEVKALASGNPLVIEKAGVDAEVAKLSTLFSVWRNQRYANESEVAHLPMRAFELCVFIGRAEDEVHLFVRGASSHECRPCQTGPALHAGLGRDDPRDFAAPR